MPGLENKVANVGCNAPMHEEATDVKAIHLN